MKPFLVLAALTPQEKTTWIKTLQLRFAQNMHRHPDLSWQQVYERLQAFPAKLEVLYRMEKTGGEPDVIGYDAGEDVYLYCDCAAESPKGRRSLCYDEEALHARKQNKPIGSALKMAADIGIELLNEEQYRALQKLEPFDLKTSSCKQPCWRYPNFRE